MASASPESATAVLRQYYQENDFLSTPEGVMKLLAVPGCLVSGVLWLLGGCEGAAGLGALSATAACAGAALLALQLAAALLGAPLLAPHAWLYSDVVGSTVLGALLLLSGVLSVALCELHGALPYAHAPLALGNAALVLGGAVVTYAAVTRRWDAAHAPAPQPRRAPPADLDV